MIKFLLLLVLASAVVLASRQEKTWETRARQDGFGERRLFGNEDVVRQQDDFDTEPEQIQVIKPAIDKHDKALYRKLPLMKNKKKSLNMQAYFALWRDYKRVHGKLMKTDP